MATKNVVTATAAPAKALQELLPNSRTSSLQPERSVQQPCNMAAGATLAPRRMQVASTVTAAQPAHTYQAQKVSAHHQPNQTTGT
jgi:hypothetical protein